MQGPVLAVVLALVVGDGQAEAGPRGGSRPLPSVVTLDGVRTEVRWIDGDTFAPLGGPGRPKGSRVVGFNTLESYGPVHSWGTWNAAGLLGVAKQAAAHAAAGAWTCRATGQHDGYGRALVACPDLARSLVERGLAHVYAVEGETPDAALLVVQKDAQAARAGMWAGGVPAAIVTSLHSMGESREPSPPTVPSPPVASPPPGTTASAATAPAYNRSCDTLTGVAARVAHAETFATCARWCHRGSCMIYVPFEDRYGRHRPACLRAGR